MVQHHNTVDEDRQGSRSRDIKAIYIENSMGERFRFENNYLPGARAMARHISNGGYQNDQQGEHISEIMAEMSELKGFVRGVKRDDYVSEDAQDVIEKATERYYGLKSTLESVSKQRGYINYFENFEPHEIEVDENDVNQLRTRLTREVFDTRLENSLGAVSRAVKLSEKKTGDHFKDAKSWLAAAKSMGAEVQDGDMNTPEAQHLVAVKDGKEIGEWYFEKDDQEGHGEMGIGMSDRGADSAETVDRPEFELPATLEMMPGVPGYQGMQFMDNIGRLTAILRDIADRAQDDSVANWAGNMANEISSENTTFGKRTKDDPDYKANKIKAISLAKMAISQTKAISAQPEPKQIEGPKESVDHFDEYEESMDGIVNGEEVKEGTMANDVTSEEFKNFLKSGPLAVGPDAYDDGNSEEEMMQLAKLGAEEKIGNFFFDDELWDNISELRDNEGDNADAMPLVRARVAELFDVSVEESVVETPRTALDVAQEIRQKELELQKLYKKGTVKDLKGAKDLMNRTKALDRINIGESSPYREEDGASIEDISSAIQHRMFIGGTMEEALSAGKGPDEIMQQIEDVAEFHEGAEELGSSDISGMVNQVLMQLGVSRTEAYVDDTALDSIYENADPFARTKLTYEDVTRELEEGNEADVDMAHELLFQGDNDADLYRQQFLPIMKNLMRKRAKGIYEPEKAIKLWRYWVDNIVKKHAKDLGIVNTRQISGATRNLAAKMKSEEQFDEMELGNWDDNKSAGTAESTEQQVVEAEGYSSLEDVYPAGPTEIWYWKEGNGRDFMMGVKWLAGRGVEVTKDSLASTHVKIGSIAETDPEKVYAMMQGENWSPQGEARDIIGKSGTGHTSMSVGDALVIGGKIQMVDRFGFVNPEDPKEVQMAESSKYSAEKTAALITDRIFEEMKNAK
jgi:hypothetical protein